MSDLISWKFAWKIFPEVFKALPQTLLIVTIATIGGIACGLLLTFIRLERIPVLNQAAAVFISFIRGTPILIQMFALYFFLPLPLKSIGIDISDWDKIYFIYITYGINTGAYFAEIFRSAILGVPKAQTDAAYSIGLSTVQAYIRIIIPQSIAIAVPGVGILVTTLLHDTSLVFTFGVIDMVGKGRILGQMQNRMLEGYIVSGIIFIILAIAIERLFAYFEKRTKVNVITSIANSLPAE
jgi:L-cystine transport system permease protein